MIILFLSSIISKNSIKENHYDKRKFSAGFKAKVAIDALW